MAPSKLSQEERTKRKREAAKLRQRRCRAKKKVMDSELKKDSLSTHKINYAISSTRNEFPSPAFEIPSIVNPLQQESMTRRTRSRSKKTAVQGLSSDDKCMSTPLRSDISLMPVVTPLADNKILKCDYGSMQQMPPLLPNVTIDIQNRSPISSPPTPPARIDEEELNAIGAMLSLRHSPVAGLCEMTSDKFPKSFKPRSSPDQSKGIFHAPLATSPTNSPPLMPNIEAAANQIPKTLTNSRCMDPRPYSRACLTKQRGIKLMEKGRDLSPGVYFYYHN
jgi:hypothetical protein